MIKRRGRSAYPFVYPLLGKWGDGKHNSGLQDDLYNLLKGLPDDLVIFSATVTTATSTITTTCCHFSSPLAVAVDIHLNNDDNDDDDEITANNCEAFLSENINLVLLHSCSIFVVIVMMVVIVIIVVIVVIVVWLCSACVVHAWCLRGACVVPAWCLHSGYVVIMMVVACSSMKCLEYVCKYAKYVEYVGRE